MSCCTFESLWFYYNHLFQIGLTIDHSAILESKRATSASCCGRFVPGRLPTGIKKEKRVNIQTLRAGRKDLPSPKISTRSMNNKLERTKRRACVQDSAPFPDGRLDGHSRLLLAQLPTHRQFRPQRKSEDPIQGNLSIRSRSSSRTSVFENSRASVRRDTKETA